MNPTCDKCLSTPYEGDDNPCEKCNKAYTKKEVIIAQADDNDYIHAERFETTFEDETYAHMMGTQFRWKGKVKITIEQLEE